MLSGGGEDKVADGLLFTVLTDEEEGIVGEESGGGKADGDGGVVLDELEGEGALGEKIFDGPGVGLGRIGSDDGFLQGEEFLAVADDEAIVGHGDDVGAAAGGGEADGDAAGTGIGGVVGDGGIGGAIGEADGDGDGRGVEMGGAGERGGFDGGGEGAGADDALGVDGAVVGSCAVDFDHGVEDLLGQSLIGGVISPRGGKSEHRCTEAYKGDDSNGFGGHVAFLSMRPIHCGGENIMS